MSSSNGLESQADVDEETLSDKQIFNAYIKNLFSGKSTSDDALRTLAQDLKSALEYKNQYEEEQQENEQEDETEQDSSLMANKRGANSYLRFGRNGPAYLRFGRAQAYLRFGKRAPNSYLRFGKRNPAYLRFGRK